MIFEWDSNKAINNLIKHSISFDLAALIFNDPFILSFIQSDYDEERWQSIGQIQYSIIYVIHTMRENHDGEEIIHIISARKANANEKWQYQTQ